MDIEVKKMSPETFEMLEQRSSSPFSWVEAQQPKQRNACLK
jgi:hypothetical protein